MCNFSLTVIYPCKHELPTMTYCPQAPYREPQWWKTMTNGQPPEILKHVYSDNGSNLILKPCTVSAGWQLYRELDAPIDCLGCKT